MASTTPRHTQPARRTDPTFGPRLRALREARGLTQAQLAGDQFTKGFISQLETGRTKPSLNAAQVISGRLGISVADLLGPGAADKRHLEIELLRAERELAAGSPDLALKIAQGIKGAGRLRGRLLRLQGRAHVQLDRGHDGVRFLRDALAEFRHNGDAELAARTLYDLAFAHARLNEPEEAVVFALECSRALWNREVVDRALELQVETFLAAAYVHRGDFAAADMHIDRALGMAQDVVNREALAALYSSLATSFQEQGDLDRALRYWQRSLEELHRLGHERAVADAWHNISTVHLRRGRYAKAREALARAADIAAETAHASLEPWIAVTRGKLALRMDSLADAERYALEASRASDASARCRAEALLLLAEILGRRRAPLEKVRETYEAAIALLKSEPGGVRARALGLYADALAEQGDDRGAYARSREALALLRPAEIVASASLSAEA